ncbi:hypothetical protein D9619_003554 [Psilocybe cf. subviscida]|uniref:Uncharacterized protein n=1 Tax=Psilocybe cf. subviscida TaxID=2480587 RepID=A0A8H5AXS8_9AGAR|nr:hypothetical protein D9619_003554 [Psilocybe cf. subviscida]
MSLEKINSPDNRDFSHILSHAVKVPGLIFLSGQVPADKDGNIVPGGIKEHTVCTSTASKPGTPTDHVIGIGMATQAQCIHNLGNVLKAAGSSWEKVVKCNVYLKNMDDFAAMNEVYQELLPTPKPARTCIQAAKLPNDVDVEIEAIAAA